MVRVVGRSPLKIHRQNLAEPGETLPESVHLDEDAIFRVGGRVLCQSFAG